MARIRTIKPEFYRHHDLYKAEKKYQLPLRLAFSGLWLCADREGRFKWKPINLKLDVLPFDEIDFTEILFALCEEGFIQYYEVDGKEYGVIPSFKEHQRITGSEAKNESKLPCPPISYEKGNTLETLRKNSGINLDDKERERIYGKDIRKGDSASENIPKFELQKIYEKTWDEYKSVLNGQAQKISEIVFIQWKEFVDFIQSEPKYHDIFNAKFVTPIDFGDLLIQKKFIKERWKGTVELMLATGIMPNHNLYFRIPQFMNYEKINPEKNQTETKDVVIKLK